MFSPQYKCKTEYDVQRSDIENAIILAENTACNEYLRKQKAETLQSVQSKVHEINNRYGHVFIRGLLILF